MQYLPLLISALSNAESQSDSVCNTLDQHILDQNVNSKLRVIVGENTLVERNLLL